MKSYQEIRDELEVSPDNIIFTKMLDGVPMVYSETERATLLDDRANIIFAAQATVIPVSVSFRGLAFALLQAGIYSQVKAAALSTPHGEIWWNTSQSDIVRRDHPFVAALAETIGQTEEQLDDIFVAAKDL